MLLRCILAEHGKLRHSVILPACILIPVIPAIMGTFNYLQNQEILKAEWYSLWTQNTLFLCLFLFRSPDRAVLLLALAAGTQAQQLEYDHDCPGSCILPVLRQTDSYPGDHFSDAAVDGDSVSHMRKARRPYRVLSAGSHPVAVPGTSGCCADLRPSAPSVHEDPEFFPSHRHCAGRKHRRNAHSE